jgi:predicted TIM-barrel fold metal-dependent hydrolase
MTAPAFSPLRQAFRELGKVPDCPIYDMHGHMGPWRAISMPYNDVDSMVRRMDLAGIELLAFSHHSSLSSPDIGNAQNIRDVRRYPDRLRAWCSVNPNYPEIVARDLREYDRHADVWVGLKLHPDIHGVAMSAEPYRSALSFADERRLPVLSHTWGGSPFNGAEHVRAVAERYAGIKLLLGHSLHARWDEATDIARTHENVYLELTAVPDERTGVIEKFVREAGSAKVIFGTDFPWFSHHYYIGAVLAAEITDEERRDIFYRNAERILGIAR